MIIELAVPATHTQIAKPHHPLLSGIIGKVFLQVLSRVNQDDETLKLVLPVAFFTKTHWKPNVLMNRLEIKAHSWMSIAKDIATLNQQQILSSQAAPRNSTWLGFIQSIPNDIKDLAFNTAIHKLPSYPYPLACRALDVLSIMKKRNELPHDPFTLMLAMSVHLHVLPDMLLTSDLCHQKRSMLIKHYFTRLLEVCDSEVRLLDESTKSGLHSTLKAFCEMLSTISFGEYSSCEKLTEKRNELVMYCRNHKLHTMQVIVSNTLVNSLHPTCDPCNPFLNADRARGVVESIAELKVTVKDVYLSAEASCYKHEEDILNTLDFVSIVLSRTMNTISDPILWKRIASFACQANLKWPKTFSDPIAATQLQEPSTPLTIEDAGRSGWLLVTKSGTPQKLEA